MDAASPQSAEAREVPKGSLLNPEESPEVSADEIERVRQIVLSIIAEYSILHGANSESLTADKEAA